MDVIEVTVLHHVGIALMMLWLLSHFNCCYPVAYFLSLIYLYLVHERYVMRLRRKLQFEERKQADQRRDVLQAKRTQLERELSLEDTQRIHDLPAYNLLYQ